jgi:hypothetical protein
MHNNDGVPREAYVLYIVKDYRLYFILIFELLDLLTADLRILLMMKTVSERLRILNNSVLHNKLEQ